MLARYNGRIVYIDGFAGPGRYHGGEAGSPLIALQALLDHRHFQRTQEDRQIVFFFIEADRKRANHLQSELTRLAQTRPVPAWVTYHVEHGKFAPVMTRILDNIDRDGAQLAPTFAFIDPFGWAGVPLQVVSRITAYPRCEVLITFMYESINRFLGHPNSRVAEHFDALFGTRNWRNLADVRDPDQRQSGIVSLYADQLRNVAGLPYVRTFEMINEGNRTEYFLYFGTRSRDGLSRMKEAMWRVDPVAGQSFSDRTATGQTVLLEPRPDLSVLQGLLQERFRGKGWVSIEDVEDFVLLHTPYSERKHLRRATLAPMERDGAIEAVRPAKARAYTYPEGTLVRFK